MGMTIEELEYVLKLRDEATAQWGKVKQNAIAASKEISSSVADVNGVLRSHGEEVSRVSDFYKKHRGEQRETNFYYRQGKDAITAMMFGYMAMAGTMDTADEKTKKLNQSLIAGFTTFQGFSFMLTGLGVSGPIGLAAAGIAGLGIAINTLVSPAKEAAEQMKSMKESAEYFIEGIGGEEAQREVNALNHLLEDSKTKVKNLETEKERLNKATDVETIKRIGGLEGIKKYNKETEETIRIERSSQAILQSRIAVLNDLIEKENHVADVRQRQQGSPEAREKRRLEIAKALFDGMAKGEEQETKNETKHLKNREQIRLAIRARRQQNDQADYEREKAQAEQDEKNTIAAQYRVADAAVNITRDLFGKNKLAAQANALINTYQAATMALTAAPPPWNFILEAAVIAEGIAQQVAISKQSFARGTPPGGFTVPPGYPNDTYPIGVSSHERVYVTPADRGGDGGGGGHTFIFNFNSPTSFDDAVVTSIKKSLRKTGLTVDKLLVNNRGSVSLS